MYENDMFNEMYQEFNNCLNSHSFLFYTNNFLKCRDDIFTFLKKIFLVDDLNKLNNDFIIVSLDGKKNILKDDVIKIKKTFVNTTYFNKYRFYLIEEADKLNSVASNLLLKFLEEPENNIIGFFITTNLDNVMPTIKSRCQIKNCFYDNQIKSLVNDDFKILDSIFSKKASFNIFDFKKNYFIKYERNDFINLFVQYLSNLYLNSESFVNNGKMVYTLNKAISMLNNNVNIEYVIDFLLLEGCDN